MKRLLAALVIVSLAVPALASGVEGEDVKYVGGTIANMKDGAVGRLDMAGNTFVFDSGGSRAEIPYASIQRFQYTQPLARRLGVAATIAVGIVKRRQRLHVVEVYFRDTAGANQVGVFEVSKDRPASVVAVLHARVPRPARPD